MSGSTLLTKGLLPPLPRRSASEWETALSIMEQPASTSEEATIERAARMVKGALDTNPWFANEGVTIAAQGSYYNNTNVRQKADMDIRVVHPSVVVVRDANVSPLASYAIQYSNEPAGRTNAEIAGQLRTQVDATLRRSFGTDNVTPGKRAFRISAVPGSRSDLDVVPCLTYHRIGWCEPHTLLGSAFVGPIQGIWILGTDRTETINHPAQHHAEGKKKREQTGHRFKKLVRTCKSLRDELVANDQMDAKALPSFLVECLVYRVENDLFVQNETRLPRVKRILGRIYQLLSSDDWVLTAREINNSKLLFGAGQPWTAPEVRSAIGQLLLRLEA